MPVHHDGDISAMHTDILCKRVKHETKNYFTKAEKPAQTQSASAADAGNSKSITDFHKYRKVSLL